jgi:HTH-type transcriptional regulator/antitoxin HigA
MSATLNETKYAAVLSEHKPKPIHSDRENERAIALIERLYAQEHLTAEEETLAELMTTLVEHFEEERYSLKEAAPVDVLRFLMDEHGLRQSDIAPLVGSKGIASEILSGKRTISRAAATRLAARFNVSYRLFL